MKTVIKVISVASNAKDPVKLVKNINTLVEITDDVNRNKEHPEVYKVKKNRNLFSSITIPILEQIHGTPAPDDTVPILERMKHNSLEGNSVDIDLYGIPINDVFASSSAKKSILDIPKYVPTACDFLDADDVTHKNCCADKIKHDENTSELFCVDLYPVNHILQDSDVKLKSFSVHSVIQRDSVSDLENMVIIS